MAQRVVQYQAALQLATTAPNIYDLPQLHRQMLEVLGIKNVQKIVPLEEDQKPEDPVTENMAIITGKPVKAFSYQDHEAHIKVHMNAAQDPLMQKIIGQHPNANAMQSALQAHIAEHVAFQYRVEIEKMLGVTLPPPEERLPEDIEVELSRAVAAASEKLLQRNQSDAQQQAAQEMQQDPVIQMQQKEVAIKEANLQRQLMKDQKDAQLKEMEILIRDQRERERISSQEKVAGAQIGASIVEQEKDLDVKQKLEGVRIGAQLGTQGLSSKRNT
jgi:hypothetical protein